MRSENEAACAAAASAMRLKDKVAIVTGAASGIGKEIALTFARAGAKVAIADLNKGAARSVAEEIAKVGGSAIAVGVDVTNEAQVEQGVKEVVAAYGGVDVLVSNAGVQIVHPIENFPFADWKRCWPPMSTAHSSPLVLASGTCRLLAKAAASSTWARCIRRKPRH
jgi:NAD(P)-dependent dehydrogenase (short-subunit alcohol dehydrogenase family)